MSADIATPQTQNQRIFESSKKLKSKTTPETIKRVQSDLEKRLGPKNKRELDLDITEIQQVALLVNEILEKGKMTTTSAESRNAPSVNSSSKRGHTYEATPPPLQLPFPPPPLSQQPQRRPPQPRTLPRTDSIRSEEDNTLRGIYTIPSNDDRDRDLEKMVAVKVSPYFSGKFVSNILALIQVCLILLFAIFTSYDDQSVTAIPRGYVDPRKPTKRPLYDKNFYNPNYNYNNERPTYNSYGGSNSGSGSSSSNENEESSSSSIGGSGGPRFQPVTQMPHSPYDGDMQNLHQYYYFFQDVHVMIFVGFGFLMTFLRKYGYSAVGYNLLIAAIAIQWSVICRGMFSHSSGGTIMIDITTLINGDFVAASVLITFGAVLGVTSPFQLVIICIIEVFLFALNEYIGTELLKAIDIGGSMFIHTFGAYFGLAMSLVLRKNSECESPNEGATYTSDLFSMIGTVFLWMFWPSFNGAMAEGDDQHRAVINTVLSLSASCVFTFAISGLVSKEHKFNMVHIQNATLAGGVAVGAVADLMIRPYGALIIGSLAGILSTVGYTYVTPFLQSKLNLHDTCGVNNLHGMPGIMSGLAGVVMALIASEDEYGISLYKQYPAMAPSNSSVLSELRKDLTSIEPGEGRSAGEQALYQLLALGITLCIAIVGGALTGFLMKLHLFGNVPDHLLFDDGKLWEVPELEEAGSMPHTVPKGETNHSFELNNKQEKS